MKLQAFLGDRAPDQFSTGEIVLTAFQNNKPLFLSNDEAAKFLRLSPRTLEKLRVVGGGPPFRKFRRRVFYAVEDLQDWASCRSFDTTSDPHYRPYGI